MALILMVNITKPENVKQKIQLAQEIYFMHLLF